MISDASKWLYSLAAAAGLGALGAQAFGLDVTAVLLVLAVASAALVAAAAGVVARDGQPANKFESADPRDTPAVPSAAPFALAAAGTALAAGLAINTAWAVMGWALLAIAGVAWLVVSVSDAVGVEGERARDAYSRFSEPVLAPVAGLVAAVLVIVALSRVLLTVTKEGATAIALATAVLVMIGVGLAATRRRFPTRTFAAGAGLVVAGLLVSGAISANRGERVFHPEHPNEVKLVAKGTAFEVKKLTAQIDQRDNLVLIKFVNLDDEVYHNLAIYKDAEYTERVAIGDVFKGADRRDELLAVGPVEPGTYYFRCDMHTTAMVGELELTAAGSSEHHAEG